MLETHFSNSQLFPLLISAFVLGLSILFYHIAATKKIAVPLLIIATLVLGYFIANLDPFLILWDEQYHALVAKNMIEHPLKPTLFNDPILSFDPNGWTQNHVWLHKQPLFLWQMALSIKLFGVNELAVRIPSILMHALIPFFIYRIGTRLKNEDTGFYGAVFFAFAYFPLELVAGRYSTDHNDIAFLFYVTASFWAWFEYQHSGKKYWIVLIGLFSGGAVLVKWLMGMLIYVVWFLATFIFSRESRWKWKQYLPIIISGFIALIIFVPWQIYALNHYKSEYLFEYHQTNSHLWKVIENHSESWFFHFTDGFKTLYDSGNALPFLLLGAFILFVFKLKNIKHRFVVIFTVAFVYTIYTLAQTKMVAFPLIAAPFIFLALGHLVSVFAEIISSKIKARVISNLIVMGVVLFFALYKLNVRKIENYHTDWRPIDNHKRDLEMAEMKSIDLIKNSLNKDYVVFNTTITYDGNIPTMFYTGITAYSFIPDDVQIQQVKASQKKVAILNLGELPAYILEDSAIRILDVQPFLPKQLISVP